jgi:ATP-dependent exoDNAse (exonuclease V) alpha subunit
MSPAEWDRHGFNDPDCVHLFCTNKEVAEHNKKRLLAQREPIVLIEAKHNNFAASTKSSDLFWGLETTLFLCVGAHISLTINLCSKANLVNGATGVVKDIVYAEDKKPPDLPILVMVDFGEAYTGPSFFPDDIEKRGWVPIPTFTARFSKYNKDQVRIDYTREMMPMKLAWAWTIWKAQGQTFNYKVVANLGKDEKEHGLTYVAMSRVTSLKLFGIAGGLTLDRLTSKILKQKRMVQRKLGEMKLDRIGKECLDRYKNRLRRRGNDN